MALKILIVDDITENIDALVESVANSEIEFMRAGSGKEALMILAHNVDIDLALIDVQMPEMDGFELATLMRGVEKTKNIPIIFVTAQTYSTFAEFKGSESGAIDFIFKPVNVKMLKAKIDVFQRLKVKRLKLAQQVRELEIIHRQLEESEQQAKSADALKSAFLANMSHEIRTPISSVIGFAELLRPMVHTSSTAKDYVDAILRNGQHLVELVNGILDLSKIEADQLEVEMNSIDIMTVIQDVVSVLNPLARKNNVSLSFDRGELLSVRADSLRVKQILTNLIGNAIKFSAGGQVHVVVRPSPDNGTITIEIRDTGIGISEAERAQLFRPFVQLKSGSKVHGTGLGLSLSKKLANLMNGDIGLLESEPGKGSVFLVQLPWDSSLHFDRAQGESVVENFSSEYLAGISVLLADDSSDNRMLVEAALSSYGAKVTSVENGEQAILELGKTKYDVLLLDYKMPVLDGLATTQRLRAQGSSLPIILLTANAMRGEKECALRAGACDYVSKPIDWNELVKKIELFSTKATKKHATQKSINSLENGQLQN